jgi:small subunit ribosomal protein S1
MSVPHESFEALLAQAESTAVPRRGDLLRGYVIAVTPQGVVVDLGQKRDGVVPRADLDKIPPGEVPIRVGAEVAVMVVNPVDEDGNLVVSLSQARESGDWLDAQRLMESGAIVEGVPTGYNRGGLIVNFGRLRGFVPASHLTDLPRGLDEEARSAHLQRLVGKRMPFRVIEVDPQRQRLVLSERKAIRQWRQEQKGLVIASLREGEVRKGVVTSLREFGAFVDIGGADGLIHVSELSWRRVDDPSEVLHIGQEVEAVVIRLDRQANRIGLSLKRLQPSPWQTAGGRLWPGAETDGTLVRWNAAGATLLLDEGVEGLLRASEATADLQPGSRVRVKVASLDVERERLELELASRQPLPEAAAVPESQEEGR